MRNAVARSLGVLLTTTAAVGGLIAGGVIPAAASTTTANLIKNPGAEAGPGGTGKNVNVPSWTPTTGNGATAVKYGATSAFPGPTSPGPSQRGKNLFAGGPFDGTYNNVVSVQVVSLNSWKSKIDAHKATYKVSGFFGGVGQQADNAGLEIDFRDASNAFVGSGSSIGFLTPAQRNFKTGLFQRSATGTVPAGARSVYVQLIFDRVKGDYDNGYADNLGLTLTTH
jgi:hypothetical protein